MYKSARKFKFKHHNETWNLRRTRHLYEKREGSRYTRDEFLNQKRYIDIFKQALNNGLTSFRSKGDIVVNVVDYQNVFHSILCKLNEKNEIVIISVFRTKNNWWKSFIKVKNRINILFNYIVPQMTYEEEKVYKKEKDFNDFKIELELVNSVCPFKDYLNYMDVRAI